MSRPLGLRVAASGGLHVRIELAQMDQRRCGARRYMCCREQQPNDACSWFAVTNARLSAFKRERSSARGLGLHRRRRQNLKSGADFNGVAERRTSAVHFQPADRARVQTSANKHVGHECLL